MINDIREAFNAAVRKKVEEKSKFLASGKAISFEEYKLKAGEIRGLEDAVELLKHVVKQRGGNYE